MTYEADYDSGTHTTKFRLDSSSFLDDVGILYRVKVVNSKDDIPGMAELIFQLRPGPDKIYLRSRSLYIKADEKVFEWPGREWMNIYESPPLHGRITSGVLTYSNLVEIAKAESVTGYLGGQRFDWTYSNREPMRQMIANIEARH